MINLQNDGVLTAQNIFTEFHEKNDNTITFLGNHIKCETDEFNKIFTPIKSNDIQMEGKYVYTPQSGFINTISNNKSLTYEYQIENLENIYIGVILVDDKGKNYHNFDKKIKNSGINYGWITVENIQNNIVKWTPVIVSDNELTEEISLIVNLISNNLEVSYDESYMELWLFNSPYVNQVEITTSKSISIETENMEYDYSYDQIAKYWTYKPEEQLVYTGNNEQFYENEIITIPQGLENHWVVSNQPNPDIILAPEVSHDRSLGTNYLDTKQVPRITKMIINYHINQPVTKEINIPIYDPNLAMGGYLDKGAIDIPLIKDDYIESIELYHDAQYPFSMSLMVRNNLGVLYNHNYRNAIYAYQFSTGFQNNNLQMFIPNEPFLIKIPKDINYDAHYGLDIQTSRDVSVMNITSNALHPPYSVTKNENANNMYNTQLFELMGGGKFDYVNLEVISTQKSLENSEGIMIMNGINSSDIYNNPTELINLETINTLGFGQNFFTNTNFITNKGVSYLYSNVGVGIPKDFYKYNFILNKLNNGNELTENGFIIPPVILSTLGNNIENSEPIYKYSHTQRPAIIKIPNMRKPLLITIVCNNLQYLTKCENLPEYINPIINPISNTYENIVTINVINKGKIVRTLIYNYDNNDYIINLSNFKVPNCYIESIVYGKDFDYKKIISGICDNGNIKSSIFIEGGKSLGSFDFRNNSEAEISDPFLTFTDEHNPNIQLTITYRPVDLSSYSSPEFGNLHYTSKGVWSPFLYLESTPNFMRNFINNITEIELWVGEGYSRLAMFDTSLLFEWTSEYFKILKDASTVLSSSTGNNIPQNEFITLRFIPLSQSVTTVVYNVEILKKGVTTPIITLNNIIINVSKILNTFFLYGVISNGAIILSSIKFKLNTQVNKQIQPLLSITENSMLISNYMKEGDE